MAKTEGRRLVNAWIDPDDAEQLAERARLADRSRSAELRLAIREHLKASAVPTSAAGADAHSKRLGGAGGT
jgi:hypothetical protein